MAKKARLGRGYNDLFDDNSISEATNQAADVDKEAVSNVRISLLEPNKNQPRNKFSDDKLSELAESIKENGIIQPIVVRKLDNGGYQIVAGERRWRAARLAGLTEVPVYIKDIDEKQTMQLALIENIQRQDLSPLEEAEAYKKLMETYAMTQQEVSKVVGKSRPVIANSLRLLTLAEPVKLLLENGELTAGHAKMIAGIEEKSQQIGCAAMCVKEGFSVRQLEEYVAHINDGDDTSTEKKKIRSNSFKQERPFLREFEVMVNNNSNIKTKARPAKNGGATVNITIDKDIDIEAVLSKLAEILTEY